MTTTTMLGLNRCTKYMLPLVALPFEQYKHRFVNSYVTDRSMEIADPYHIIIQLSGGNNGIILAHPSVLTMYNKTIDGKEYDMIVINISNKHKEAFDKISMGLYSEIDKFAKKAITSFPLNIGNDHVGYVLDKSEVLREVYYNHIASPIDEKHNHELKQILSNLELDDLMKEEDYVDNLTEVLS